MSDAALAVVDQLEPLVSAVTYKRYRRQDRFRSAGTFMDTAVSIIDSRFDAGLEQLGCWQLAQERRVLSLGCDFGPAALAFDEDRSPNGYPRYRLQSPRLGEEEYVERARTNTAWLRERFAGAIRLENLNYFPTPSGAYAQVCDPGFMGRVLEAIDAELLLDVAHALISCENLGISPVAYFAALPLHRVREVQISACGVVNGVVEDLHEVPGPREWQWLRWLCERAPVHYVTIEYYRDAQRLAAAYQEAAQQLAGLAPCASAP